MSKNTSVKEEVPFYCLSVYAYLKINQALNKKKGLPIKGLVRVKYVRSPITLSIPIH